MLQDVEGLEQDLAEAVRILRRHLWHGRAPSDSTIQIWREVIAGFETSEDDHDLRARLSLAALYLLTRVTYFGRAELHALAYSWYRDHLRRPIIESAIGQGAHPGDHLALDDAFEKSLQRTVILAVGGTAKSSAQLLPELKRHTPLLEWMIGTVEYVRPASPEGGILRCVFFDDFMGTGDTVLTSLGKHREGLRAKAVEQGWDDVSIEVRVLASTSDALELVSAAPGVARVSTVVEFDHQNHAFAADSRHRPRQQALLAWDELAGQCAKLGSKLQGKAPLGYGDLGLLLAFEHNTPDNSLPVIWSSMPSLGLSAPFERYS